jgi:GGDEF domain-containing protein
MYDPLIVDTFIKLHGRLLSSVSSPSTPTTMLSAITQGSAVAVSATQDAGLEDIAASTEESLLLYELNRDLAVRPSLSDLIPVLSRHLRRLMPATTIVIYVYNSDTDELVLAAADGEHAAHLGGLRIPRGQRLSGWVAANKQTILNSDPTLDLGETARSFSPRLRSCLSSALTSEKGLVGVLTLYSTKQLAFLEDHARIVGSFSEQIAKVVEMTAARELDSMILSAGSNAALSDIERLFSSLITRATSVAVVFVEVESSSDSGHRQHTAITDRAIAFVRDCVKKALRSADSLVDYGSGKIVVLLPHADVQDAESFVVRTKRLVESFESTKAIGRARVTFGIATTITDGSNFWELVKSAQGRAVAKPHTDPPAVH